MSISADAATDHVDVVIVGAGLSGVGAARHLQQRCPNRTFTILEARDAIGGTWDLFRYPGIRSDSDMHTMGYAFKPWIDSKSIAEGGSILQYVRDTAAEGDVERHVRFGHRVLRADFSTADNRWTITARRVETGDEVTITCEFLFSCSGYYRYDEGYQPEFAGAQDFAGKIVHPQHWPEDLDYAGKRVVVIGSGATAVTLVPTMAETAAHVTMLQRSPTYVVARPAADRMANWLNRHVPARLAYTIVRWRNVLQGMAFFTLCRRRPEFIKRLIRKGVVAGLGEGYDVDTHFSPRYNPWDQRMCLIPDGDLFRAIRHGDASVVTDTIDRFTKTGIALASGNELEADVIVTATGLNMLVLGGLEFSVDGDAVSVPDSMSYRGMMLGGVPNYAFCFGYTNASWTLKADLTSEFVCRLLNHMSAHGYHRCVPEPDATVDAIPQIDFSSGYIQRSIHLFPKQGSRAPWRLYQNYVRDMRMLRHGALDDGTLAFSRGGSAVKQATDRVRTAA